MKYVGYYNGEIGPLEEMKIPMLDRAVYFGDGCYDATVGANGKVYLLQDHLDRFFTSAKALDINIPMSKAELGRLLTDLLAKVDSKVNFVYWQVTRGVEPRNHVYEEGVPGKLWVSIRPNTLNDPDKPIRLNSEEDTRFYHCNIRHTHLVILIIGLLIVHAVMSWMSTRSPIADVVARLCAPVLRPFQRIIPLVGGVDLSPLAVLVLLQVAMIVLGHLQTSVMR